VLKPARISLNEKELLQGWRRYGVSALIRDKAHTVLLSNQEKPAPEIAKILYRKEDTIRD